MEGECWNVLKCVGGGLFAAVMLDRMRRTAIQTVPLWMLGEQTAGLAGNILRGAEDEEWRGFCNLPSDTTLQRSMVAGPEIQLLPLQVNIDDIPASSSGEALMFRGWTVELAGDGLRWGMAEAAVRGMSMQSLAGHSQGLLRAVAGPPFWSMGISIRGPFRRSSNERCLRCFEAFLMRS